MILLFVQIAFIPLYGAPYSFQAVTYSTYILWELVIKLGKLELWAVPEKYMWKSWLIILATGRTVIFDLNPALLNLNSLILSPGR